MWSGSGYITRISIVFARRKKINCTRRETGGVVGKKYVTPLFLFTKVLNHETSYAAISPGDRRDGCLLFSSFTNGPTITQLFLRRLKVML